MALAGAAVWIMVFDVAGRTLARDASELVSFWVLGPGLIAAYLLPPLILLARAKEAIMRPGATRA